MGVLGTMSRAVHFAPLGSEDAGRIARLQHRLFPPALTEPESEIRSILLNTEKHLVCNLSFGMFAGAEMVGYVFAYVETRSLFHARSEEVVYIKEIALLPGHESALRNAFEKLFCLWHAFTPRLPLEAHAQAEALANWRRLHRLFRFYGLELSSREQAPQPGHPPYSLLRLEVAAASLDLPGKALPLPGVDAPSEGVSAVVVTEARQWLALETVWQALHGRTADSTIEQSFHYLREWWRFRGIWNDLHIVVLRRAETVIGIAPLMIEHVASPVGTFRRVRVLGAPAAAARPPFLFAQDALDCIPALATCLASRSSSWDMLELDGLPASSAANLKAALRAAGFAVTSAPTSEEILERNVGSHANAGSGAADVAAFEAYCDFEDACLELETAVSLTDRKEDYFFYRSVAQRFADAAGLLVSFVDDGEATVAASMGILANGTYVRLRHALAAAGSAAARRAALQRRELATLTALAAGRLAPALPDGTVQGWTRAESKGFRLLASRRNLRLLALVIAKRMAWSFRPRKGLP